jgi:tetratricopeptide (TPR) repeat protein
MNMHPAKTLFQQTADGVFSVRGFQVGAAIALLSLPLAGTCRAQATLVLRETTNSVSGDTPTPPPDNLPAASQPDESHFEYQEILLLEHQGKYQDALNKANEAVLANPKEITPYIIRGHIYSEMSLMDKADEDFQTILKMDPDNFGAQFNRCEVKLTKKDYSGARAGFLALEKNSDWGDLAAYKVFVCDLFSGQVLDAQNELDAFNKVGSHASYYYANATWSFYNKQPRQAQPWLDAAERIYPRKVIHFYSATLVDRGYIRAPAAGDVQVP